MNPPAIVNLCNELFSMVAKGMVAIVIIHMKAINIHHCWGSYVIDIHTSQYAINSKPSIICSCCTLCADHRS